MILIQTRCIGLRIGRDFYRQIGWSACFAAFRRNAAEGELRWRITIELFLAPPNRAQISVRTWPAWRDEPTALAEYNRTMRLAA